MTSLSQQKFSINQCEVSYINYITDKSLIAGKWLNFLDFGDKEPEDFAVSFREHIKDSEGNLQGRLSCDIKVGYRQDRTRIYVMNLTTRGTPNTDRTILIHQAEASHAPRDAEILLLGDSSCLMDVSAKLLSEELGRPALNLGTLSYLDPAAFAILLREQTATNPGRLRAVVLLMHPEALRRAGAEPYQMAVLQDFLNGRDHFRTGNIAGQISFGFGVDIFKGRALARLLPVPLGGSYGRHYGFNKNLEDFMTANFGSAVDPAVVPLADKGRLFFRTRHHLLYLQ